MSTAEITTASLSDVGRVRTRNEDFCSEFSASSGSRLLVIADGMGGHRAGATASRVAVETIGQVFTSSSDEPGEMLEQALCTANRRVYRMAVDDEQLRGMGTTAVTLLLCPDNVGWVAHVGDSRAYRCRAGQLEPLTRDHSVVAELERQGLITHEEAASHPRRNEILRSVGVQPQVEVDVTRIEIEPGDRFVLCSDGLSGLVEDGEIAAIVGSSEPHEATQHLVDTANQRGGHDNVTVQVVRVHDPNESRPVSEGTFTEEATHLDREQREDLHRDTQRRAIIIGSVLLGGATLLALLWRLYAMSQPG